MKKIIAVARILNNNSLEKNKPIIVYKKTPNIYVLLKSIYGQRYKVEVTFTQDNISRVEYEEGSNKRSFLSVSEFYRSFSNDKSIIDLRKVYPEPTESDISDILVWFGKL